MPRRWEPNSRNHKTRRTEKASRRLRIRLDGRFVVLDCLGRVLRVSASRRGIHFGVHAGQRVMVVGGSSIDLIRSRGGVVLRLSPCSYRPNHEYWQRSSPHSRPPFQNVPIYRLTPLPLPTVLHFAPC